MTITIYNNLSDPNIINKAIMQIGSADCVIKDSLAFEKPSFILQYNTDLARGNYLYTPELQRYYYINNISRLTGGRMQLDCDVDVLESFKQSILNTTCIIDKQTQKNNANVYLNDGSYVTQEKEFHSVIHFDNGFLDDGKYILITCGGVATI